MNYYFDTCIWLNFLKNEKKLISKNTVSQIAKMLIKKILERNNQIYYSGVVLKEIRIKFGGEIYSKFKELLDSDVGFVGIQMQLEDYEYAQKIELNNKAIGGNLSLADCLHIAICAKNNLTLISRDKELLQNSKNCGVICGLPEDFI